VSAAALDLNTSTFKLDMLAIRTRGAKYSTSRREVLHRLAVFFERREMRFEKGQGGNVIEICHKVDMGGWIASLGFCMFMEIERDLTVLGNLNRR
jgi:hypothetical protein